MLPRIMTCRVLAVRNAVASHKWTRTRISQPCPLRSWGHAFDVKGESYRLMEKRKAGVFDRPSVTPLPPSTDD